MIAVRVRKPFPAGPDSAPFALDVDFTAGQGVTALFGPSGAGKTLTLDCIAGFARPETGRILLADQILFDGQSGVDLPARRRGCGYVFQNYALFPHMTLRQNLMFAADRWPRLERHRRVTELLERFRLTESAGRRPNEVSGGQKQRCSIARALVSAPKILLLDEPARGLDAPLRADLYEIVRQVRTEFTTPVLLVTHDLEECFQLADSMIVLREGKIVQSGAPGEVVNRPANLEIARLLGAYNILPVEIRSLDPGRNESIVRYGSFDLYGPYFPGRLKGDRVHLCIAPNELHAHPRVSAPSRNQVAAKLDRAVDRGFSVRLEFEDKLAVEITPDCYRPHRHNREWVVDFPSASLRIL